MSCAVCGKNDFYIHRYKSKIVKEAPVCDKCLKDHEQEVIDTLIEDGIEKNNSKLWN